MLRHLSLTLVLLFTVACGAKTGLRVPDAGLDAGVDAAPEIPCIEIPIDGGPVEVDIDVEAEVGAADIAFLIDTTASMGEEIDRIRERLRDTIAPAIREAIPDSRLSVATFEDFPLSEFGSDGDRPFELRLPAARELSQVQAAMDAISLGNGYDLPESHSEALYQLVTGAGRPPFVAASSGCPSGGFGAACLRPDALPVVLLFTDAPFHNGPGGSHRYPFPAATYADALSALTTQGVRVIGFDSGSDDEARSHLRQIAFDTGAVNGSEPLYFAVGSRGQSLDTGVVSAIRTLASTLVQDVDAILIDPVAGDGVDVRGFFASFSPDRADPEDGIDSIDGQFFRGAHAGTRLYWRAVLRNNIVAPGVGPQRFRVEVSFRGDGQRRLGRDVFDIVVPGADGTGCEAFR